MTVCNTCNKDKPKDKIYRHGPGWICSTCK